MGRKWDYAFAAAMFSFLEAVSEYIHCTAHPVFTASINANARLLCTVHGTVNCTVPVQSYVHRYVLCTLNTRVLRYSIQYSTVNTVVQVLFSFVCSTHNSLMEYTNHRIMYVRVVGIIFNIKYSTCDRVQTRVVIATVKKLLIFPQYQVWMSL